MTLSDSCTTAVTGGAITAVAASGVGAFTGAVTVDCAAVGAIGGFAIV